MISKRTNLMKFLGAMVHKYIFYDILIPIGMFEICFEVLLSDVSCFSLPADDNTIRALYLVILLQI
uniref:Putative ovule protein n=1 Tax=Solanum chacoense TaxID=4108 RepID=A0A0V0GPZ2_SOLCH